jgi:4-amino-4-deoxy-L-arabinose transferase-like glycosyltransferase
LWTKISMAIASDSQSVQNLEILDRVAELPAGLLIALAVSAYVVLSVTAFVDESVTVDELAHVPAAYTYIELYDFRLNPEHPPLVKLIAGLPISFLSPHWPSNTSFWRMGDQWRFGYFFLYRSGNDPDQLIFWARVSMLIWGIALICSTYAVARELFGPRGGLIALTLATFCPEFLAHGGLVTTDVASSALLFLTLAAVWKLAQEPTLYRSFASGLMLGGAMAAKYNAVMAVPAALLVLAMEGLRRYKLRGPRTGSSGSKRPVHSVLRWLLYLGVIALAAYTVIWAAYGFRYRPSRNDNWEFDWNIRGNQSSEVDRIIAFARDNRLLPEAYLYGFLFTYHASLQRKAFAFGHYSSHGWWWYFPAAFLVKTPVPMLILFGWGCLCSWRRLSRGQQDDLFLVIPALIYWAVAISSNINIGLRHLLPAYPPMIVLAAGIVTGLSGKRGGLLLRAGVPALLCLTAVVSLSAAPYYIAYFNIPSRLRCRPHLMLVDSNLDWGQDLRRLKAYLDRHGIRSVKLAYFGNASPRHLGLNHERLPGANIYGNFEPEWKLAQDVKSGDYVAISATILSGVLFDEGKDLYLNWLGKMKPVADIGHSILLYRIP